MTEKKILRKEMLTRRNALSEEEHRLRSKKIFENIFSLEEISSAEKIHIFSSFDKEPLTWPIQKKFLELGKIVFTSKTHEGIELLHTEIHPEQKFLPGLYKVPYPHFDEEKIFLMSDELNFSPNDLIFIPLLAFDKNFHRLGFGKGYYDVFLSTCGGKKIGLGFTFQEVDAIPHEVHDIALDMVITDEKIFRRK